MSRHAFKRRRSDRGISYSKAKVKTTTPIRFSDKSTTKWVGAARMYCKTWFEVPSGLGSKKTLIQHQEWNNKKE